MKRSLLSVGAVALLALTACGKKDELAEVPVEKVPAAAIPQKAMSALTGVAGLKTVVTDTKAAITSGDFTKATAAISKFESVWKPVSDGIKVKSPKVHAAIEAALPKLTAAIKSKDKVAATSAMTALETAMATLK
jgi:predicted small lipoprotein YifL